MSDYECAHCRDTGACQDGFHGKDGPSILNIIDYFGSVCPSCGSSNTQYADCPHNCKAVSFFSPLNSTPRERSENFRGDRYAAFREKENGSNSGDSYSKSDSSAFVTAFIIAIPLLTSEICLWINHFLLKNAPYDSLLVTLLVVLAGLFLTVLSIPAIIFNAIMGF